MRDYKHIISEKIKYYRELRKMSKKELADMVGKTPSNVSFWETGRSYPSIETFFCICDALQVSADQLAGRDRYLSSEDREILDAYHRSTDAEKPLIRRTLGIPEEEGREASAV